MAVTTIHPPTKIPKMISKFFVVVMRRLKIKDHTLKINIKNSLIETIWELSPNSMLVRLRLDQRFLDVQCSMH
jgi:hypothetical protein